MQLLPHLTELGPLVKRITQAKAAGDEATRDALEQKLEAIAAGLRQDITGASLALPAELIEQLAAQSKLLAEISHDLRSQRSLSQEMESRLQRFDKRQAQQQFVLFLILLTVIALLITVPLMLRHR